MNAEIATLEAHLEHFPHDAEARLNFARALDRAGASRRALSEARKAAALEDCPADVVALHYRLFATQHARGASKDNVLAALHAHKQNVPDYVLYKGVVDTLQDGSTRVAWCMLVEEHEAPELFAEFRAEWEAEQAALEGEEWDIEEGVDAYNGPDSAIVFRVVENGEQSVEHVLDYFRGGYHENAYDVLHMHWLENRVFFRYCTRSRGQNWRYFAVVANLQDKSIRSMTTGPQIVVYEHLFIELSTLSGLAETHTIPGLEPRLPLVIDTRTFWLHIANKIDPPKQAHPNTDWGSLSAYAKDESHIENLALPGLHLRTFPEPHAFQDALRYTLFGEDASQPAADIIIAALAFRFWCGENWSEPYLSYERGVSSPMATALIWYRIHRASPHGHAFLKTLQHLTPPARPLWDVTLTQSLEGLAELAARHIRRRVRDVLDLTQNLSIGADPYRGSSVQHQPDARSQGYPIVLLVSQLMDQVRQWRAPNHFPKHFITAQRELAERLSRS